MEKNLVARDPRQIAAGFGLSPSLVISYLLLRIFLRDFLLAKCPGGPNKLRQATHVFLTIQIRNPRYNACR